LVVVGVYVTLAAIHSKAADELTILVPWWIVIVMLGMSRHFVIPSSNLQRPMSFMSNIVAVVALNAFIYSGEAMQMRIAST
jgi:hypothetical protein